MARYKGKHRKPAPSVGDRAKQATVVATVAGAATVGLSGTADAAPNWDPIIACESGGNFKAENPTSTASGGFQFLDSTWQALGGKGSHAANASVAEQYRVANKQYAISEFTAWAASKSCWAGKTGAAAKHSSGAEAPPPAKHSRPAAPQHALVDNRAEDGSGSYTCDNAHLRFELCDPDTLGKIVAYPKYRQVADDVVRAVTAEADTNGEHTVVTGDTLSEIAAKNGTTWQALFAKNGDTIHDADLIFPGEHIRL